MLQRIHLGLTLFLALAVGGLLVSNRAAGHAARAREAAVVAEREAVLARLELLAREHVEAPEIRVGDELELIDEHGSLRTTETVGPDGKILVPEAGWVEVRGLTREQAETRLTEALRPFLVDPLLRVKLERSPRDLHALLLESF